MTLNRKWIKYAATVVLGVIILFLLGIGLTIAATLR